MAVFGQVDHSYLIIIQGFIQDFCRGDMTKINDNITYFWGFLFLDVVLIK